MFEGEKPDNVGLCNVIYIPRVHAILASSGREGDEEGRHESGELHFVGVLYEEQNESV